MYLNSESQVFTFVFFSSLKSEYVLDSGQIALLVTDTFSAIGATIPLLYEGREMEQLLEEQLLQAQMEVDSKKNFLRKVCHVCYLLLA